MNARSVGAAFCVVGAVGWSGLVGASSPGLAGAAAASGEFECPSPDVLSQAVGTPVTPDPTGSEPCRFALDLHGQAFIVVLSYAAEPDLDGCFMPYQPGPLGPFQDLCGTAHAQLVQAWNPWGSGWLYLSVGSGPVGSIDDHLTVGTAVLQALGVLPGAPGTPEVPDRPARVDRCAELASVNALCARRHRLRSRAPHAGTDNPTVGRIPRPRRPPRHRAQRLQLEHFDDLRI